MRGIAVWLLLLWSVLPALACAEDDLTDLVIQLRWKHQFQFAGYYAAVEQGYYREAGLNVIIRPGGPGRQPVSEVLAGRAHYGEANAELLYQRLLGEPLVALASIFQHSPSVLLTRVQDDIQSPQDLIGQRVMLLGGADDVDFMAMFLKLGIEPARISFQPSSYDISDLIGGRTEAFNAYLTNEPYFMLERGVPYRIINPRTYGIDFYSDILFTTEAELRQHPQRVRAVHEATLRGWRYALDHVEEMIELIRTKYGSDKSLSHLRYEARTMRDLIMPDLIDIGHMHKGRWQAMADTFVALGLVEDDGHLEGFIYDPHPAPDYAWLRYLLLAILALLLVLLGWALGLVRHNRHLKREISVRQEAQRHAQQNESLLQRIIDHAPALIYVKDGEGRFLLVNQEVADLYDASVQALRGQRQQEIHPDGQESAQMAAAEAQVFSQGVELKSQEEPLHDSQGRRRWMQSVRAPFTDESGADSVLTISIDITARKELEHQLMYAQKMEAVGTLTGGIAHEFNNILAVMIGNTELARMQTEAGSKLDATLEKILSSGLRAKDLIGNMLVFSRHTGGEMVVVQMAPLVKEFLKMVQQGLPSSIDLNVDAAVKSAVRCDPNQIQQLLVNLVTNAVQALPEHKGWIRVALRDHRLDETERHWDLPPGEYVMLEIRDSGEGIAPELQKRIFDPFFTTREVGEGSGLGLSVVHGIVKNHEGAIRVSSARGEGACFQVLLPTAQSQEPLQNPSMNALSPAASGVRVLVVDDEPDLLDMVAEGLTHYGFEVTAVGDSQQALALFEHDPQGFDCLITDQTMPGLTGLEMGARMRALQPDLPMILCSGFNDLLDDDAISQAGFDLYVQKPLSLATLADTVRHLLA